MAASKAKGKLVSIVINNEYIKICEITKSGKNSVVHKTVTIPATVVTISKNAFAGCKKLKKITLKGKKVTVKKGAFKGVNTKKVTIKASKMNAKQFKAFKKALKKAGFKGKVTK